MKLTLTYDRALALLQGAVALRGPDFNYLDEYGDQGCRYAVDGKPACLLGVAMANDGVPIERLTVFGQRGWHSVATNVYDEVEPRAKALWSAAQNAQDDGASWGAALDDAVRYAANYAVA